MRLLLVVSELSRGGAEHVIARLTRLLPMSRYEVHVALWRPVIEYDVLDEATIHVIGKYRPWHVARAIRRTKNIIEAIRPDVVLSTLAFTNVVTGEALRKVNPRPRWICRFGNPPSRQLRGVFKWWAQNVLKQADWVVGNSRGLCEELAQYFGIDSARMSMLPNLLDLERIDALSTEALPFHRPADTFVVVHAGRLHRQKHQELILRAFARLTGKTELWMLGQGARGAALRRLAHRLEIENRIRWVGFDKNPYRYFRAADCFALSSRWEGLPNAMIECMACGTPVVATRCRYGPEELVHSGKTGLLVPCEDVAGMATAFQNLQQDPERSKAMGEDGRQAILQRFDVGTVLEEYESLFPTMEHR